MKKYHISIEQPLCKTWEVEAESLEQALEIGREKYNKEEWVLESGDYGTDAQIKGESEEENEFGATESTDWNYL